jgi:hypothetical protein
MAKHNNIKAKDDELTETQKQLRMRADLVSSVVCTKLNPMK